MRFQVNTQGHEDSIDITDQVAEAIKQLGLIDGIAVVFGLHSTIGITTLEYEKGVLQDVHDVFERLIPENAEYKHNLRGIDHNGAAHIKSAMVGTHLPVPVEEGQLVLGQWQRIVLIDFDERARTRDILVKALTSATTKP